MSLGDDSRDWADGDPIFNCDGADCRETRDHFHTKEKAEQPHESELTNLLHELPYSSIPDLDDAQRVMDHLVSRGWAPPPREQVVPVALIERCLRMRGQDGTHKVGAEARNIIRAAMGAYSVPPGMPTGDEVS